MNRIVRLTVPMCVAATLALTACGGGGGGTGNGFTPSGPTVNPPTNLQTASTKITLDLPGTGTSSSSAKTGSKRATTGGTARPQFIDTAYATQLVISVSSSNGNAVHQTTSYAFNTASNCTGNSPPVCTYNTTLPVGNDVIQLTLEDTNNRPIAQSEVTSNVTQGTNTIQTVLNGIVATLNPPSCQGGTTTFQADGQHIPVTWGLATGNAAASDIDEVSLANYKTGITMTATPSTSSGTLAAGTYKYIIVFKNGSKTPASLLGQTAETSATLSGPGNIALAVTGTVPTGTSEIDVYRTAAGGASNSEVGLVSNYTTSTSAYTDAGSGYTPAGTGAPIPGPNAYIGTPGLYAATATSDSAAVLNPLTISSSNSQAKFSINGGPATNPAVINGPADNVVLVYSGSQIAGTAIPITIGASVPNSVPGLASVAQVTSNSCTITGNSTVGAPPSTAVSVNDTGTWTLQNGANAGQQASPYNGDCFEPSIGTTIGSNDAQCYYAVSGSLTSFTGSSTHVAYVMSYTGSVLLNYWTTSLQTQATMTGTYLFVDTNNPHNTFTGVLSGTFLPTTAPTSPSNGQVNASLESSTNSTTTWTLQITGTGGAFAGVNGTLTIGSNTFSNVRDTTYPQLFDYTSIPVTGTLTGI